ncbi:unnamed protein product [Arabidopsis halleri]
MFIVKSRITPYIYIRFGQRLKDRDRESNDPYVFSGDSSSLHPPSYIRIMIKGRRRCEHISTDYMFGDD